MHCINRYQNAGLHPVPDGQDLEYIYNFFLLFSKAPAFSDFLFCHVWWPAPSPATLLPVRNVYAPSLRGGSPAIFGQWNLVCLCTGAGFGASPDPWFGIRSHGPLPPSVAPSPTRTMLCCFFCLRFSTRCPPFTPLCWLKPPWSWGLLSTVKSQSRLFEPFSPAHLRTLL